MKRTIARALALLFASVMLLGLAACGVKSDLVTPSGHKTPAGQTDPSKPQKPI